MSLKLRITDGPLKGQEPTLHEGFGIGRKSGDVILDDSKVSSLHAVVRAGGSGLVLVDNGSKNGIRDASGEKVQSIDLRPGSTFQIGASRFEVILVDDGTPAVPVEKIQVNFTIPGSAYREPGAPETSYVDETAAIPQERKAAEPAPVPQAAAVEPSAPPPIEADSTTPPGDAIALEPLKWSELLEREAQEQLAVIEDQPRAVVALNPALSFVFTRGLQAETRWVLGYGPRRAGSTSLDLPIFEPKAPEVCFEIIPTPDGVTFRTSHPNMVQLNGRATAVQPLSAGDIIAIGGTRIEVDLIK